MLKTSYLVMAVVGAIVPYLFFIPYIGANGPDPVGFVAAWFVNDSAGGLAADLLISSVVFWIWLFSRADGPRPWPFIALNLAIGLSCALPAYLYVCERRRGGAGLRAR